MSKVFFAAFCIKLIGIGIIGFGLPALAQPPHNLVITQNNRGTIVDIAAADPNFSTLVRAVQAAGLAETLSSGEFTLFAPTNEAFAALPKGTLENLLLPENREVLRKILTYHVVSGSIRSTMLATGQVTTVAGINVTVVVQDGRVQVNQARVVAADIQASNGVIHVIDRVLLPPDLIPPSRPMSYIGVGGAIGVSGNTTSLSSGGLALLTRTTLAENFALHSGSVVFGDRPAASTFALTVNVPVREESANQIVAIPFLGGGIALQNQDGLIVSPLAVGGVDIPLSESFTGTLRLTAAFPSDRAADLAVLLGVGFNVKLF